MTKIMTIWYGEGIEERWLVFFFCYVEPSGAWWQIKINLLLFFLPTTAETDFISSQSWYLKLNYKYKTTIIHHLFLDPTDSDPGDTARLATWRTTLSSPMFTEVTTLLDKDWVLPSLPSLFLCNLYIYNLSKINLNF